MPRAKKKINPNEQMTLDDAKALTTATLRIISAISLFEHVGDKSTHETLTTEAIELYSRVMQTIPKEMAEQAVSEMMPPKLDEV